MSLGINGPEDPSDLEQVGLETELAPQRPSEYGRVLLVVLSGDALLSIRADQAEECWRILEPVLHAWEADAVPFLEYPASSDGPPQGAGDAGRAENEGDGAIALAASPLEE